MVGGTYLDSPCISLMEQGLGVVRATMGMSFGCNNEQEGDLHKTTQHLNPPRPLIDTGLGGFTYHSILQWKKTTTDAD